MQGAYTADCLPITSSAVYVAVRLWKDTACVHIPITIGYAGLAQTLLPTSVQMDCSLSGIMRILHFEEFCRHIMAFVIGTGLEA